MKKIACLVLGLLALVSSPSYAADDYIATGGGVQRAFRAKDVNGKLLPLSIPSDVTGALYGTGNGLYVRQDGSWTFGLSGPVSLATGTTVGITGALPLPTGAATAAKQPGLGTAGSASADVLTVQGIANGTPIPVTGSFSATTSGVYNSTAPTLSNGASSSLQLDASGNLRVTGSFSATTSGLVATSAPSYTNGSTQSLSLTTAGALRTDGSTVTQPVSASALPLPTGASTEATLTALSAKVPASLGAKVTTSSLSVTLASDQAAVPVTGTFFQATQPVSAAALPLPSGAATATAQTTGNTSLASIDTKTPALVSGAVPVDTVQRSTSVNRGGTLTTANTAVTLVPANASRRGLAIQNRNAPGSAYSATTSVFMNCLATATADFNSLEIPAGALYETPAHHSGTGACSFISATASTPVYVREF